jgi:hypothetical protein
MVGVMKNLLRKLKRLFTYGIENKIDKLSVVTGKIAVSSVCKAEKINSLSDVGFSIYSQFDEDGIIEWLIQRLPISSNRFIEFGVENYIESNTRFLLINRNWRGLIIDSNPSHIDYIKKDNIYWRHDLTAICAFATPDKINELLKGANFTDKIGILSIDAGGMDYWIWKETNVVDPDIVICEYNAVFGDLHAIVVPYQNNFESRKIHYSGLYWGASSKAFELLALEKGYVLLGSNIGGHNLFFLRKELYSLIDQYITDKRSKPSLYRDSRSPEGKLTYTGGLKRYEMIKHLSVYNIETKKDTLLETIFPIYSENWFEKIK